MIAFIIGLFLGCMAGIVILSLCVAAGRADMISMRVLTQVLKS